MSSTTVCRARSDTPVSCTLAAVPSHAGTSVTRNRPRRGSSCTPLWVDASIAPVISGGGTIEFLGRVDRQVKIAGHRIELGEIDSTLERLSEVRAAVASAVPGPDDRPRLICFVVDAVAGNPASDTDLVAALRVHLPPYMIPSRFVCLPSLPVTPNGKVDHRALPNPFKRQPAQHVPALVADDVPPATEAPSGEARLDVLADALARGLEVRLTVTAGVLSPRESLDAALGWADHAVRHLGDAVAVDEVHATNGVLELHIRTRESAAAAPVTPAASTHRAETSTRRSRSW